MTHDQEQDLADIQVITAERIAAKYRKGQKEHGGNLWERPALPELVNEVTDLNTYVVELGRQMLWMHETVVQIRMLMDSGGHAHARDLLDKLDSAFRAQVPTVCEKRAVYTVIHPPPRPGLL